MLDPVTGRIAWPSGLTDDLYKDDREHLDELFADRALAHGAIGVEAHGEIRDNVNNMLGVLKQHIRDYGTNQYLDSKNFLESLAYEASAPTPGSAEATAPGE